MSDLSSYYKFQNAELLSTALTHKSFHNENPQKATSHNELFEFLGDAVLELALTDHLMTLFPQLDEGELSKIRASLVNEATLAEMARELNLQEILLLGRGEKQMGGALKPRILASTLEALIGAIFKDSDFHTVRDVVEKIFSSRVGGLDLSVHFREDYKTRLQEKMQGLLKTIPQYELAKEEGPDHDKMFHVNLLIGDRVVASGSGRSKKQAEQDAARRAMEVL